MYVEYNVSKCIHFKTSIRSLKELKRKDLFYNYIGSNTIVNM